MKRILYSLILALGFSACAPLLAPPKEGIEGIPGWVRRRDREERAIANRQIEAARQRQELRAARAKAEEERIAAEAASGALPAASAKYLEAAVTSREVLVVRYVRPLLTPYWTSGVRSGLNAPPRLYFALDLVSCLIDWVPEGSLAGFFRVCF